MIPFAHPIEEEFSTPASEAVYARATARWWLVQRPTMDLAVTFSTDS